MRAVYLIAALGVVALAGLFWSQQRNDEFYISGIIEAESIRVGSRVGGRIQSVEVAEGQRVSRGATLVTLEPFDLQERLAETEATLAARTAVAEKLKAGYRKEEIEQARARRDREQAVLDKLVAGMRPLELQILQDQVDKAQADLIRAEAEFERIRKLRADARAAQQEFDDAVQALASARASFAAARDELALAKEGTRVEEIAEARARLAEAQSQLALLEAGHRPEDIAEAQAHAAAAAAEVAAVRKQIAELTIVAPLDGIIEALELEPGDLVTANAPVLSLLDPTRQWVRAFVPEGRLDIRLDQKVRVRVDAYPDEWFKGHVSFVAQQAEFTPSNAQTPEERVKQMFRVKVSLDSGRDKLRAGMSADVFPE